MDVGLIQVIVLPINILQSIIYSLNFGTNDRSNSTIKTPASTGPIGESLATPSHHM